MRLEERQADLVIAIVLVDVCVQGAGVDNQRDRRASRRMISSIRRAVLRRPLRPAFAAIRRRRPRPPKCASMASRVTSAMVVPRRAASCRSLASVSLLSFTVVRFMVCQHTQGEPVGQLARAAYEPGWKCMGVLAAQPDPITNRDPSMGTSAMTLQVLP